METTGTINGREVQGIVAGITGGNDQGYTFLIGSVKERWRQFKPTALNSLNSFKFTQVQRGFEHERWEQRLKGARLIFYTDYGNYILGAAQAGEFHFCSDGRYFSRTDYVSTQGDAWGSYTYGTTDKSKGNWRVRFDGLPYVNLSPSRGAVESYVVSEDGAAVMIGGMPYRFARNDLCE